MTSRLISLIKLFPRLTGAAPQAQPQSWALIDIWRHLFISAEGSLEEEPISTEPKTQASKITTDPILSEAAISARRQFLRDNFKNAAYTKNLEPISVPSDGSVGYHHVDRLDERLYRPFLGIPVGDTYIHLAQ